MLWWFSATEPSPVMLYLSGWTCCYWQPPHVMLSGFVDFNGLVWGRFHKQPLCRNRILFPGINSNLTHKNMVVSKWSTLGSAVDVHVGSFPSVCLSLDKKVCMSITLHKLKGWSTANAQTVETTTDYIHNNFWTPLRLHSMITDNYYHDNYLEIYSLGRNAFLCRCVV